MLCTNCSETVKPVVALDIDGTLGDYHGHFLKFALSYLGNDWFQESGELRIGEPSYDGSVNFGDWCECELKIDRPLYRDIKLAYRVGAQKRLMPVFEGAADLARRARQAGAELWLTTSRPYMRLDNIDPDTRAWLERNNIEFDYLLYGDDKYSELRKRVQPERVVAVLDDLVEMCVQAESEFGAHVPIRRVTRWNVGARYSGWEATLFDAADEIVNRIEGWKEIAA